MTKNLNEAELELVCGGLWVGGERRDELTTVGPEAPADDDGWVQQNDEPADEPDRPDSIF